jgi:hypothetical protein
MSNSFYGMQAMSSDSAEVRDMLIALISKLKSCREPFLGQHVGNYHYLQLFGCLLSLLMPYRLVCIIRVSQPYIL